MAVDKQIEENIKEAIKQHSLSFLLSLPSILKGNGKDWFYMAYNCVRGYKATKEELEKAYSIFMKRINFYRNEPFRKFILWLNSRADKIIKIKGGD